MWLWNVTQCGFVWWQLMCFLVVVVYPRQEWVSAGGAEGRGREELPTYQRERTQWPQPRGQPQNTLLTLLLFYSPQQRRWVINCDRCTLGPNIARLEKRKHQSLSTRNVRVILTLMIYGLVYVHVRQDGVCICDAHDKELRSAFDHRHYRVLRWTSSKMCRDQHSLRSDRRFAGPTMDGWGMWQERNLRSEAMEWSAVCIWTTLKPRFPAGQSHNVINCLEMYG